MLFKRLLKLRIPLLVDTKAESHHFSQHINNIKFTPQERKNVPLVTVDREIKKWCRLFHIKGVTEPMSSIQHIMASVLRKKVGQLPLLHKHILNPQESQKLQMLCKCRLARMPIPYIINEWDFRNLTLKMKTTVFIPRPETEKLVDLVLNKVNTLEQETVEILEVGCGTGAISLALAQECPKVKCTAIEKNKSACKLSFQNNQMLNLENQVEIYHSILKETGTILVHGVYTQEKMKPCISTKTEVFDIIVSNPPYIPSKEIAELPPEISVYESRGSLDGGPNGLIFIQYLLKCAIKSLKVNGSLFMEVDPRHPKQIKDMIDAYYSTQLNYKNTYTDFSQKERYVEITKQT